MKALFRKHTSPEARKLEQTTRPRVRKAIYRSMELKLYDKLPVEQQLLLGDPRKPKLFRMPRPMRGEPDAGASRSKAPPQRTEHEQEEP